MFIADLLKEYDCIQLKIKNKYINDTLLRGLFSADPSHFSFAIISFLVFK